jgi:hypothetical protein
MVSPATRHRRPGRNACMVVHLTTFRAPSALEPAVPGKLRFRKDGGLVRTGGPRVWGPGAPPVPRARPPPVFPRGIGVACCQCVVVDGSVARCPRVRAPPVAQLPPAATRQRACVSPAPPIAWRQAGRGAVGWDARTACLKFGAVWWVGSRQGGKRRDGVVGLCVLGRANAHVDETLTLGVGVQRHPPSPAPPPLTLPPPPTPAPLLPLHLHG